MNHTGLKQRKVKFSCHLLIDDLWYYSGKIWVSIC